jgi:HAD superfamily hydrolase (TIGR01509 family)
VTGFAGIVFDFDGVIADSETIANATLSETLTAIGLPTTYDDSLREYCGHNWRETERRIVERLGRPLPADFRDIQRRAARDRFERELAAVPGVSDFLDRTRHLKRAIASSSSTEWLALALERIGLAHHFEGHLYSAADMDRGKPFPDIYLAAARGLGLAPEDCLAIEDSPVGASAAVAAGMHVMGLVAGGHIADRERHAEQLRAVGVHRIAYSFAEIAV